MSGRVRDCVMCNGTGIDEAALDERCTSCSGSGEVDDDWDDYDPYLDEPNYHDVPEDDDEEPGEVTQDDREAPWP